MRITKAKHQHEMSLEFRTRRQLCVSVRWVVSWVAFPINSPSINIDCIQMWAFQNNLPVSLYAVRHCACGASALPLFWKSRPDVPLLCVLTFLQPLGLANMGLPWYGSSSSTEGLWDKTGLAGTSSEAWFGNITLHTGSLRKPLPG